MITDNQTGKKFKVSGDSPPTEQEAAQIFADMGGKSSQPDFSGLDTIPAHRPGQPVNTRKNKLDRVISKVVGDKALDYMKTPPTDGNAISNLPRSLANTAYGVANMVGMPYEGLSKGAILASFPGSNPTPEQQEELKTHDLQALKSFVAPTGLAGIGAAKEAWSTAPVQSLLTVAPYAKPALSGSLRTLGKGIEKASAPFKSRMTPETENLVNVANAKGIRMSPADITGSRIQGLSESMLGNLPSSADMIQRFREGQLADFANKAIQPITSKMGASGKTFSEVGRSAQESVTARSKTLDKLVTRKFDKARDLFPKKAISTIDENAPWRPSSYTEAGDIPTTAAKTAARKIMSEEADVLKPLKDTEAITVLGELANTDAMSFDAVQRNLSRLKDIIRTNDKGHATGGKFQSNSTAGAFKRVVRQLENDVDSFAAEHGGAFETAWHEARNTARAGYELFDSRKIRQVMNAEPSQLVNHFRNKNADSVNLIKKAVGPRSFDQLRGAWLESIIKTNEKGQVRPASLGSAINKIDRGTLESIFKPGELKEIQEIANLGQRLQGAEKVAGNPSGTGQTLMTPSFYGSIGAMVATGNIPGAITTLFTPPVLAKLYLSKAGRQYLTEGFKIKPDTPQASAWLRKGQSLTRTLKDARGMVGKDINKSESYVHQLFGDRQETLQSISDGSWKRGWWNKNEPWNSNPNTPILSSKKANGKEVAKNNILIEGTLPEDTMVYRDRFAYESDAGVPLIKLKGKSPSEIEKILFEAHRLSYEKQ
jgi:hypothetical protein